MLTSSTSNHSSRRRKSSKSCSLQRNIWCNTRVQYKGAIKGAKEGAIRCRAMSHGVQVCHARATSAGFISAALPSNEASALSEGCLTNLHSDLWPTLSLHQFETFSQLVEVLQQAVSMRSASCLERFFFVMVLLMSGKSFLCVANPRVVLRKNLKIFRINLGHVWWGGGSKGKSLARLPLRRCTGCEMNVHVMASWLDDHYSQSGWPNPGKSSAGPAGCLAGNSAPPPLSGSGEGPWRYC